MRETEKKMGVDDTSRLLGIIEALIAEVHPARRQRVELDSRLDRDLGLDSLGRIELLSRVEREFGVTLAERAAAEADTPRDLLRVLHVSDPAAADRHRDVVSIDLDDADSVPHRAETLLDVLRWHVEHQPTRPVVHFYHDDREDDVATYADLWTGAVALATGLQHGGLEPGGRVSIMLPTGRDYLFTFFGILLAGGVPVPIYPPARRTQIEDHLTRHRAILENAGAALLVTVPEARVFAKLLESQVEPMRGVVTVDELSTTAAEYRQPAVSAADTAFLQYTSGSTGQPKGVILSHANLLANLRAIGAALAIDDTDIVVSWLPLYHDMGLIGSLIGSLYYACPLVLMSPIDFLTRPQRWLNAIHRYRGTLSASPNFGYELCVHRISDDDLRGLDLTSWRAALNGAEPVSADTIDRFCGRFGEYGFRREALMPVYGLAENSLGVTFPPLAVPVRIDTINRSELMRRGQAVPSDGEDEPPLRVVGCGRPLPGHEVRVVDDAGRELPEREVGRVQFRGPSASSGYFKNAEATRHLFDGDWLDSGDLAYVAEGDLFVTGRLKDIVIRAGRNIAPAELEEAIGGLEGIRAGNVAVFGSAEPGTGTEQLIVIAETRSTGKEPADRLVAEINALAVDLVGTPPDHIRLVPPGTVLKTSSGKIRRSANRDIYERGELGDRQRAVWWQIARVALGGLAPWARRLRRRMGSRLYAAYMWALVVAIAPIVWPLVVLLPNETQRWRVARGAARLLGWATGTLPVVAGAADIPPAGPCVLVANHASYLDSFALMAALPRPASYVAKRELKANPLTHLFLRRLNTRFVERFDKQRGIENARHIGSLARKGWPLLYFPEGRLARMPGLRPFHMGAFVAAAENAVPVVPIALRGTRSVLRPGTRFPRRAAVSVTVGPPIPVRAGETDSWAAALALKDAARAHILKHCGEPDLPDDTNG